MESALSIYLQVKEIESSTPGLKGKLNELSHLIGPSSSSEPAPAIFIHGDSSTGKTLLIDKCLELDDYCYATINCVESYLMKLIYENILNQIAKHKMTAENKYQPYAKCSNMMDFITELRKISLEKCVGIDQGKSIIIVLDKCEKLLTLNKNVIPAFVKLRELSGLKISVIMVSTLSWNHLFTVDHVTQPVTIFMEQYEHKELLQILLQSKPTNVSESFYENYIKLFLSVFYNACHDLRELEYQAKLIFKNYYEPIANGELTENDAGQLWKRSQVYFKKALKSLYLKVDCNMELSEMENITSATSQALIMELPYYSKYILIASYIASYNPASEDKRLFAKNSGKHRKSTRTKADRPKHHLIGPKAFGIQRLFAIVSAILNYEKFTLNADLFVEVSSLVQMKLLTQVSDDVLDNPNYKCNVGLQFVDIISRNVQFPIRKYLVDFMD